MNTFSDLTENQVKHNAKVFDLDDRFLALIEHLDIPVDEWEDVEESSYDSQILEHDSCEYLVLDDDEADEKWDEHLDNYIDECLEIPEHLKNYFDSEKWKDDAKVDGRGHSLSSYDGNEEQVGEYYIYRIN